MLKVRILCVGKLKERYYLEAEAEYLKRLRPYCEVELTELPEIPAAEGNAQTRLRREAQRLQPLLGESGTVAAMCVEGKLFSSEEMAGLLKDTAMSGAPRLTFVIGGSDGLDESVKASAQVRMSMSRMTFPHHLARVMLLEQLYRGCMINAGTKYHK